MAINTLLGTRLHDAYMSRDYFEMFRDLGALHCVRDISLTTEHNYRKASADFTSLLIVHLSLDASMWDYVLRHAEGQMRYLEL